MEQKNKYKTWEEVKKELNLSPQDWEDIEAETTALLLKQELRAARKKYKVTQAELAKRANLPRSTITRFESGDSNPTIGMLKKVAKALNMKVEVKFVYQPVTSQRKNS